MRQLFSFIFALFLFAQPAAAETQLEADYAAEIAEAESLGRIIYDYDIAASVATDLLVEEVGDLNGKVTGWIVEETDDGERVLFYRGSNGLFTPAYSVNVRSGKAISKSFTAFSDEDRTTPAQTAMIKARETGLNAGVSGCANSYNTVVIPDETIGYLVYVLAAATDADVVQIGGHLRHDIDPSGERVVGFRKFTNSCFALGKRSPDGKGEIVAMIVSQVVTVYPTEIHVWASLLHKLDIYVVTGPDVLWKVSNGKITDASSIRKASFSNVTFEVPPSDWSILKTDENGEYIGSDYFEQQRRSGRSDP